MVPDNFKEFNAMNDALVNKLMKDNIVIKEDPSKPAKKEKEKPQLEDKVMQMLVEQIKESKAKRDFERTPALLGMTNEQFLASQEFNNYYRVHQNEGLEQIDKNKDLMLAKDLFACWDKKRFGHISIEQLSEELISFGMAVDEEQVVKLI